MPKNKFQEVIFTIMMVFVMVFLLYETLYISVRPELVEGFDRLTPNGVSCFPKLNVLRMYCSRARGGSGEFL